MRRIYLDHHATSRPFPEVADLIHRHLMENYANPGSRHAEGRRARQALEDARECIARCIAAEPDEVIFTSGGTESINLAIRGLASGRDRSTLTLPGEHPATAETLRELRMHGRSVRTLSVDADGRLDTSSLQTADWPNIGLATALLAHNETGVVQRVTELAECCREHGVLLHLDAVQAAGKIPVRFRDLDCAALSFAGHKFHGPRGIGVLVLRRGTRLKPFITGGHQEEGRRPGTECVALAAGMALALERCVDHLDERTEILRGLRDQFERAVSDQCRPCTVVGRDAPRLPNTSMILFHGLDAEALLVNLDLAGVACSAGTTCASGALDPSPMLMAMGYSETDALSAIRFCVSTDNTADEITEAAARVAVIVRRLRAGRS